MDLLAFQQIKTKKNHPEYKYETNYFTISEYGYISKATDALSVSAVREPTVGSK